MGDVTGKGLEVAALSAMVRFFVEARTWDSERPGEVLAQTDRLLQRPAAELELRDRLHGRDRRRDAALGQRRARAAVAAASRRPEVLKATGVPLGVEASAYYEERETPFGPGDMLFASTDGLIEARRDGSFFGERPPAGRPGRARPHAEPARARRPRLPRGRGVGAAARRRRGHPRPAPVAVIRRERRRPARRRRRSSPSTSTLVRERLGDAFVPTEQIFATDDDFVGDGAAWLVVYEGDSAVACGGLRPLGPGVAEIKRMFVTARARGRGHARTLLAELERLAARRRARARAPLHDRGPARGARPLRRVRLSTGGASPRSTGASTCGWRSGSDAARGSPRRAARARDPRIR